MAFIFLPDLFTPYMEGREAAINRNWTDLEKYNNVQKGQLSNLFELATFAPKANREYEQTEKIALENIGTGMDTFLKQLGLPGAAALVDAISRGRIASSGQLAQGQLAAQAAAQRGATAQGLFTEALNRENVPYAPALASANADIAKQNVENSRLQTELARRQLNNPNAGAAAGAGAATGATGTGTAAPNMTNPYSSKKANPVNFAINIPNGNMSAMDLANVYGNRNKATLANFSGNLGKIYGDVVPQGQEANAVGIDAAQLGIGQDILNSVPVNSAMRIGNGILFNDNNNITYGVIEQQGDAWGIQHRVPVNRVF